MKTSYKEKQTRKLLSGLDVIRKTLCMVDSSILCFIGERIESGQIMVNKSMPLITNALQTGESLGTVMI